MKKILLFNIPIVVLAFVAGMLFKDSPKPIRMNGLTEHASHSNVAFYTCSMHPSVKLQDPNSKCSICAMDLIPVTSGTDDLAGFP